MLGGPRAFLVILKNILFLSALCIQLEQSMHVDYIFLVPKQDYVHLALALN